VWPSAQALRAKLRHIGYGVRSDFELNLGRYLPSFGPAEDDGTEAQPDADPQTQAVTGVAFRKFQKAVGESKIIRGIRSPDSVR